MYIPTMFVLSSPIISPFAFILPAKVETPDTTNSPRVPTEVNEELTIPPPKVFDVNTSIPSIS